MIGYIKGTVLKKDPKSLVIDVNSVGYKVTLPASHLEKLRINDVVSLQIHTHVKEDQITLFGFISDDELKIFELLLEVSGVGPRTALSVISAINPNKITTFIQKAKVEEFTKIPGIGKKVAQKIIVELQSKMGKVSDLSLESEISDSELTQALQNLGFTRREATEMSKDVDPNLEIEQKIKLSLKSNETKRKNG